MTKIVFDTNVLLDYSGTGCSLAQQKEAAKLMNALYRRGQSFIVSPTTVKDFQYLLAANMKKSIREQKGQITPADASAVSRYVKGTLENILTYGSVASLGQGECEMARTMCSAHNDYEDNLIAALALRIGADCIVTRDRRFSAHSPVTCLNPTDALTYLESGVFA